VTIPLKNADGSYVYDVDATPKAGTVDEPDKPDKPVTASPADGAALVAGARTVVPRLIS
jgi:hypothetical protein